jgi:hypothetical protein
MAMKTNWEAMLTAWKHLVAKPQNAGLKAEENKSNCLLRGLQEVKLAEVQFRPNSVAKYQSLCLRLDDLIRKCKYITDHFTKGLHEATKFLNGVSLAAKNRKTLAHDQVRAALVQIKGYAGQLLKKLLHAGDNLALVADAWLRYREFLDADNFEFPYLEETRRKIVNMAPPNTRVSKLTMGDYKLAIFNFMTATSLAF